MPPSPKNNSFRGPLSSFVNRYFTWFIGDLFVAFVAIAISGVIWRLEGPLDLGVGVSIGVAVAVAMMFSAINYLLGLGRISWRRAQPAYAFDLAFSSGLTTLILFLLDWFWPAEPLLPPGMILVAGLLAFLGFTILRYRERLVTGLASRWVNYRGKVSVLGERVLIVGAGECGQLAGWLLKRSDLSSAFNVVGMVDDDPRKHNMRMDGYSVLGSTRDLPALVERNNIGVILYAITRIAPSEQEKILALCRSLPVRLVIIPDLIKILQNHLLPNDLKESCDKSLV